MITTGLLDLPWWGVLAYGLVLTHITIAAVTIYLHRSQAHRALALHPLASHFFRFWLWLTTGMVTREWVAIHRKHHAKVESADDPHSPRRFGIKRVLLGGWLLYRDEASNNETLEKYGFDAPSDWVERNVYSSLTWSGIATMLVLNMVVLGAVPGLLVWAMQMLWIPFWAAGVINGLGHYLGYRNYEVSDASTNIVPWGLVIGGEELHNNHHAFASSAKFATRPWEFDIGWMYIRGLQAIGLARVKKTVPQLHLDTSKRRCDVDTVRAVFASRFHIMASFTREVLKKVYNEELQRAHVGGTEQLTLLRRARRVLVREKTLLDDAGRSWLNRVLHANQALRTVYAMREALQDIWKRSAATQENLVHALEEWRRQAEASGIQALRDFARKLPAYSLAPV
jgi:stearoyl-CoA desaturase (delta-9 desaturase)